MRPADKYPELNDGGISNRLVVVAAGLAGAIGVMAAAAASHGGESRNLSAIASICLAHGPALLALGLMGRGRLLGWSAALLATGTILFAADLGFREWLGHGLFAGAAPLAGLGMISGWLAVVFASALSKRIRK